MLLTLDEFRGLRETGLSDESVQLLLDAAEAEIVRAAGPVGEVTEFFTTGGRLVALARPASSVTSITETSWSDNDDVDTLATDDYLRWPGGYVIERLTGGTHSHRTWQGRVAVTYVPEDDVDIRKVVQADLTQLMLSYAPGTTAETVGAWSRQLAANSVWNTSLEREAILARLHVGGRMSVV